jgi:hypothetical protein
MEQHETLPLITPAARHGPQGLVVPLLLLAPLLVLAMAVAAPTAGAADPDLQLWIPAQFIHPFGKDWAISMKPERHRKLFQR